MCNKISTFGVKKILILLLIALFVTSCGDNIKNNKGNIDIDNNTGTKIEQNTTLSSDEEDMVNEIFDM